MMPLKMDEYAGSKTTDQIKVFLNTIYNNIVKKHIKVDENLLINASAEYDEYVDFECVIWLPITNVHDYYTEVENIINQHCIFEYGFVPNCYVTSLNIGESRYVKISLDIPIKFFNTFINYYKLKNSDAWKKQSYCLNL